MNLELHHMASRAKFARDAVLDLPKDASADERTAAEKLRDDSQRAYSIAFAAHIRNRQR